jgi:hypothetical protein
VRFQENCITADFELCKKGEAQFFRPKIFNLYFLYRLKKMSAQRVSAQRVLAQKKIVTIFDLHISQAVALKNFLYSEIKKKDASFF